MRSFSTEREQVATLHEILGEFATREDAEQFLEYFCTHHSKNIPTWGDGEWLAFWEDIDDRTWQKMVGGFVKWQSEHGI